MLETGSEFVPDVDSKRLLPDEPLRLVWSGLFQAIKALPLLLEALSRLPNPLKNAWTLDVLGDGEERNAWHQLSERLGLARNVRWHGMLPKEKALEIVATAHVLVHSSVKEGTPHVVLEALSLGLPVICHDACGMGTAVNPSCGRKIPLVNCQTSKVGFTEAVREFLENRELVMKLSEGAITRARELSWENKTRKVLNSYNSRL